MGTAFVKYKKLILFLLIIFVAFLVYFLSEGGFHGSETSASPTGYYIDPPRNYFYLKDRSQNEVVQWLQRVPRLTYPMGERYESPYTFEQWLENGKDIDDLEDTLLFLYTSRYKRLLSESLSEALKRYGTQKSVDFFSQRLQQNEWIDEYKNEMHDILYGIINDEDKFRQLIETAETNGKSY